jgi:hypothetical protein
MNTELFQQIHDIITTRPEAFDMATWEYTKSCGTTRCVAGWAVHLTTGEPLFAVDASGFSNLHPSVEALAEDLGVEADIQPVAGKLLGLETSDELYSFHVPASIASRFVELAASGAHDAAREVVTNYRTRRAND